MSPSWAARSRCRDIIPQKGNEGYPKETHHKVGDSVMPIVFQIIVTDGEGERLRKLRAWVSVRSKTDGRPDWVVETEDDLEYIPYTRVVAWASLS